MNYLFNIQEAYTNYIRQHNIRTLFIDVSNADFLDNKAHLQVVLDALEQGYRRRTTLFFFTLVLRRPPPKNIALICIYDRRTKTYRTGNITHPRIQDFYHRPFFYVMALRMVTTIIGWRIYEITHNPFAIGLIGLSEFLPAFSLALYAGTCHRQERQTGLLLRTTTCYLLCVAGLLVLSFGPVLRSLQSHWIQWLTYFIIFCTGVIRAFAGPALNAIIAQIVPKEKLPGAVTINTSAFLFASVWGTPRPAFSSPIPPIFSPSASSASMRSSPGSAFSVFAQTDHGHREKKTWESIKEGLRFVVHTKEVLGRPGPGPFCRTVRRRRGPDTGLCPRYPAVGPIGFGWLNAADDIGSIIMITSLTLWPLRRRQGMILLYAVFGFGVCIIVFGLSKLYLLSFFALICSGMLDGISVVIRGTIVQLKTPDPMRGRVSSVNSMFINSSNELGQFESGVMAKLLGSSLPSSSAGV
jgi:hypothetical protein